MLKLNIGDLVIIKSPLSITGHIGWEVDRGMAQYAGRKAAITGFKDTFNNSRAEAYTLDIDNERYGWLDTMFE